MTRSVPRLDPARADEPVDRLGRGLRDLRISVTDRCNFRCRYCMPREMFGRDFEFLARRQLLSFEEIERIARLAAGLGVRKLRLTGGEPLLRRELDKLIGALSAVPGIDDIALTTNASLLTPAVAAGLREAGLDRINVSLDGLDDESFRAMTDVDYPVQRVLDGIDAAADAGLGPIKINMVVKRGTNDDQILPMAEHFRGSGNILRFIEYMDVGNANRWRLDEVLPARELVDRIAARWPVEALPPNHPGEVANRWRYADGQGEIGVIASVTQPFCGGCRRLRMSAEGKLFTCLFGSRGYDLRALLRSGASDEQLADALGGLWRRREDRYSELRSGEPGDDTPADGEKKVEMSYIGG